VLDLLVGFARLDQQAALAGLVADGDAQIGGENQVVSLSLRDELSQ
jgi:hypothetical protein